MALRFRRSVKLAPGLRANFSGSGMSLTAGPRGASVNFGSRGTFLNSGIPGTGLHSRSRLGAAPSRPASQPGQVSVEASVRVETTALYPSSTPTANRSATIFRTSPSGSREPRYASCWNRQAPRSTKRQRHLPEFTATHPGRTKRLVTPRPTSRTLYRTFRCSRALDFCPGYLVSGSK